MMGSGGSKNRRALFLRLAGTLPADPAVNELDATGEPIVNLPVDSPARRKLEEILSSLNGGM